MEIDKDKFMQVRVESQNQKMHYFGEVENQLPISIDYTAPYGDNLGYSALELLLLSLSSCVLSTVTAMLRGRNFEIQRSSCSANGIRSEALPMGFVKIELKLIFTADELCDKEMEKVLTLAEESICPVWGMLKNEVEITVDYEIPN